MFHNPPAIEIIDSRKDLDYTFIVVGDCIVPVKKKDLNKFDLILKTIEKVCGPDGLY